MTFIDIHVYYIQIVSSRERLQRWKDAHIMLSAAERSFEKIQAHFDICLHFWTPLPMTNEQVAKALGVQHDPSGVLAPASLFFQEIGEPGEIEIVGMKIDDHTFGVKPSMPGYVEAAKKFASRKDPVE